MSRPKKYIILIMLQVLILSGSRGVGGQHTYDEAYRAEALANMEHVTLFTDRDMYAVNERIYFRSFYRKDGEMTGEAWSKVLYVELVTPAGRALASGKFPNGPDGSSGWLDIPPNALTGRYYVRAYTRWMRNFGPRTYSCIPLDIVNPNTPDVLEDRNESSAIPAGRFRMDSGAIECHTDKQEYVSGEEVRIELSLKGDWPAASGDFCLTVVPGELADPRYNHFRMESGEAGGEFRFNYLPDIRGVSISGSVIRTEDQSPSASARLYFSLLGNRSDLLSTLSDESGRFILTLPDRNGTNELFVAPEPSGGILREVLIDQDFSNDPVPFASEAFTLSGKEREAAIRMARNVQLSLAFRAEDVIERNPLPSDSAVSFYGIPDLVINTEDFISLPTMAEIFENLVETVYVKYTRGRPSLIMESPNSNISMFPPLILVDNIPVLDQALMLSADPSKIYRIEVINQVYVKGDMSFGGLISIRSKQGDMAAIDLPEGSYFFDYQAFHPASGEDPDSIPLNVNEAGYRSRPIPAEETGGRERIPDTRNSLLWIESLNLRPNEKIDLKVRASSSAGEYLVLVRGVNSRGGPVCAWTTFRVDR